MVACANRFGGCGADGDGPACDWRRWPREPARRAPRSAKRSKAILLAFGSAAGGGATLVRQELARHPERLRGVKVLVWEFAERDLLAAETEWAKVELPR